MSQDSEVKSAAAAAPLPPPIVLLSADRVTFTVESGIIISSRGSSPSSKSAPASSIWLKEFNESIRADRRIDRAKFFSQPGYKAPPAWTPPEVQAFYHSSVLPLPSTRRTLGDNSNGLVCACLSAFTEVSEACCSRLIITPLPQHKRLVLRPDDIFFPLLDAAATHVFQNGEASRNVFVGHAGKKVQSFAAAFLYSYTLEN